MMECEKRIKGAVDYGTCSKCGGPYPLVKWERRGAKQLGKAVLVGHGEKECRPCINKEVSRIKISAFNKTQRDARV